MGIGRASAQHSVPGFKSANNMLQCLKLRAREKGAKIYCDVVKVANEIYVAQKVESCKHGFNMMQKFPNCKIVTNWEQYVAPHFRRVFKVAKIMLPAHSHYYAAALGGKVTVLQSLVITPTLHLKSKIDKNTGAA